LRPPVNWLHDRLPDVTGTVRDRLLAEHGSTVERALACADAVAAGWDGETTVDRETVVGPYRACLRRTGLLEPLVAALADAVTTAGYELAAEPVPDVPYLAVTGEGVVLRGPTAGGTAAPDRVVVTLRAFEVDPYRRGPGLPAALEVEVRSR
jgi:hypothetical protein